MKKFMDEDFLLQTETAKRLYHDHAANMPIFDYHCHISPKEIAENKKFEKYYTTLALWRPLQMACDAYQWCG